MTKHDYIWPSLSSAEGVMYRPNTRRLSVCLLATSLKNYCSDLRENCQEMYLLTLKISLNFGCHPAATALAEVYALPVLCFRIALIRCDIDLFDRLNVDC